MREQVVANQQRDLLDTALLSRLGPCFGASVRRAQRWTRLGRINSPPHLRPLAGSPRNEVRQDFIAMELPQRFEFFVDLILVQPGEKSEHVGPKLQRGSDFHVELILSFTSCHWCCHLRPPPILGKRTSGSGAPSNRSSRSSRAKATIA